jgi:hypothetical protein
MKHAKWTYFLLALVIMLIGPSATVKAPIKTKPTVVDNTWYYWFDAYNNYLWRQCTIYDEMALTGLDPSESNPKTVQEKGWSPGMVTVDMWGEARPLIPSFPDKKLYSHP